MTFCRMLTTLGGQYALVIGCEALSRLMDPTDRSTCVLFGDGAGAAVFELTNTSAPFAITLGARGDAAIHVGGPSRAGSAPISMDGRAVFRFAVDALPKCLHTVLDETGLTLDNLDWVVCHQAKTQVIAKLRPPVPSGIDMQELSVGIVVFVERFPRQLRLIFYF